MPELYIAIIALILGGGAFAYSIWRPNVNGQRILDLQKQIADMQEQHDVKIRYLQKQTDDLQEKYLILFNENLRLSRLDTWRQNQLIKARIEIEPIPVWLMPPPEQGNILISVNQGGRGGVIVSGGQVESKRDIVGGMQEKSVQAQ